MLDKDKTKDYKAHAWLIIYVQLHNTHTTIGSKYTPTSDVYKLNKVSHSWEAIGHIPSARDSSAAVSTADNRVIVIGGMGDKGEYTNAVWIGSCDPQ